MRYAPYVLIALSFTLLAKPSGLAQGQPCSNLQAVPGAMGYQHRSASERCEGFYQSPVAGESLEILSFVGGSISYNLETDKVLFVAVPDVSRFAATEVNVRARALPLGTYYRMDAKVASAKAIEWPLNAVIAPAQLLSDSIGVIGWIEQGAVKIYVPVSVVPGGKPPPLRSAANAVLRSPVDIEQVQWRLSAAGATGQPRSWQALAGNTRGTIRAGEPIRIPIAASSQTLNLEIAAKMANSDEWLKTKLRVFMP